MNPGACLLVALMRIGVACTAILAFRGADSLLEVEPAVDDGRGPRRAHDALIYEWNLVSDRLRWSGDVEAVLGPVAAEALKSGDGFAHLIAGDSGRLAIPGRARERAARRRRGRALSRELPIAPAGRRADRGRGLRNGVRGPVRSPSIGARTHAPGRRYRRVARRAQPRPRRIPARSRRNPALGARPGVILRSADRRLGGWLRSRKSDRRR